MDEGKGGEMNRGRNRFMDKGEDGWTKERKDG
jgi:hypothetical protein